MDLRSALFFLGLWRSISCQTCQFSSDPTIQSLRAQYRIFRKYESKPCEVTYKCEDTSDIQDIRETKQLRQYCLTWKIRVILKSIYKLNEYDTYFTHVTHDDKFFTYGIYPRIFDFEITDSACSRLPSFDKLTNIEIFRMHNTNLKDMSFTSHNNLVKLSFLDLSQNKISNINRLELNSSSHLQVLNVSHNLIVTIKDQVFQHVSSLRKLDLASNRIDNITSLTFYGLNNLNILYLSHNRISDINSAFGSLTELEEIYLDNNNLIEIKENCFKGLEKLVILKLNSNSIIKFDWTTMKHIPQLKTFDVSYNRIKNITNTSFVENNDLNYVDLSFNNITQLIPNMFLKNNISFFAIQYNSLEGVLESGMFAGIIEMKKLDLSHQHIEAVGDNAFYGLTRLSNLLLNDNKIKNITKNSFNSLINLKILDLSNNMLQFIDLGNNQLISLKSLLLKKNFLTDIGSNCFMEMESLEFLDLSQNNLTSFNSDTYGVILPHLIRLNISYNNLQIIQDDIFNMINKISDLDLSHNSNMTIAYDSMKLPLATNSTTQASLLLRELYFKNCNIDNVIFLRIHLFKDILFIYFNHNKIPKIDYRMFSSSKKLAYLNLSYNKISYIEPGSFTDNNNLKYLIVAHNELIEIEHGCFLGLNNLNSIDISFNKIKTFKHGMFYEAPSLSILIADNNSIDSVEYKDFVGANLNTLSIGGNPIPCIVLVNLETETHSLQVTALNKELHSPNFKGVSCYSGSPKNDSNTTADDSFYLERREVLLEDIRNILLEIKKANFSQGYDSERKSSVWLQISNLTQSIKEAFYKIDEANYRLVNNIANFNNNSELAQAYANMSTFAQNIIKTVNKSDETDNKIIQLITKIDENSKKHSNNLQQVCLILITVVMLCFMGYKVYELNLFSLSRRRRAESLQHINDSIVTATF